MLFSDVKGHHGTNYEAAKVIADRKARFAPGMSEKDWLGTGTYFWFDNKSRAIEWISDPKRRSAKNAVIEADIHLGHCLYVNNSDHHALLVEAYERLAESFFDKFGYHIENIPNENGAIVDRSLDCLVINTVRSIQKMKKQPQFQSAIGLFEDGPPIFPGSALRRLSHMQMCIFDPTLIRNMKIVWHD